jgi:peptidyl-prolyl cis-trans isomerase SurA
MIEQKTIKDSLSVRRALGLGLAAALCLCLVPASPAQPVDCILALVNGQVITLSDIKILDAFGFFPQEEVRPQADRLRAVLERFISQKIVIDMAKGQSLVPEDKVEAAIRDLESRLSGPEFGRNLEVLGLARDDLKPYVKDMVLFEEVINSRFGRSVTVTLNEIESYYDRTYLPARKKSGAQPAPLLQVLTEIESLLRKDKIAAQADSWIANLRRQGSVEIKDDCLKNLEEERS